MTLVVLLQAEARGQCFIDYYSGCLIDFNSCSITVPFILSSSHAGFFIPDYSLHTVMSRYFPTYLKVN